MGFRSGLVAGHFRTVQHFLLIYSWVLFDLCLGSLSCWKLSDTGLCVSLQNALIVFWLHCVLHRFKAPSVWGSKATLKHHWASSMFHGRLGALFFEGFIFSSVNIGLVWFTKKLLFCLIGPKYIFPEELWLPTCMLAKSSLAFLCLPLRSGIFLGLLPWIPFSFRQWWMVRLEIIVLWTWRSACICIEVLLGSFSIIRTTFCSIFGQFSSCDHVQRCWLQFHGS